MLNYSLLMEEKIQKQNIELVSVWVAAGRAKN